MSRTGIIFGFFAAVLLAMPLRAQIFYNNGATVVTKLGSTVQINGAATNNTGSIDDSGTITITTDFANNSTATAGGSGTYYIGGNFTNNSTWNKKTGTVNLDGTSNQNVGGTQKTTFYDLQFTNGGSKTLTQEEIVDSNCYFNNGICYTTQTNVLHFDSLGNWVNISGMPTSSCVSYVDGPCEKDFNSMNFFQFPVGKAGRANTCGITPQSAADATFRTQYFDYSYSDIKDFQSPLQAVSGVQYWHADIVSPSSPTTNAIIRLYWIPGDYQSFNMPTPSNLVVARWDTLAPNPPGPTPAWVTAGKSNIMAGATYNSGWIESAAVIASKYGTSSINRPFTLSTLTTDNSLPVEMGPFTAHQVGNHIALAWQTYSEIDSRGFELDRTRAGSTPILLSDFESDTALMAKSPSGAFYQTVDDSNLTSGPYTYLLYQVDRDGARTQVGTQMVDFSEVAIPNALNVSLYPNPATAKANVNFDLPSADHVRLDVYDITGRLIAPGIEGDFPAGPHQISIDVSNLAPGSYDLVFTSPTVRILRSLAIER